MAARLRASSAGDEAAFADLYDLTATRAFGLACRVLRNAAHAEEVVQEAYLEIWRTAARFDPDRGSAISWIMVIVHRRAIDRIRSEEARTAREDRDHLMGRLSGAVTDATSELAFAELAADRVRAAMVKLPRLQRETLELTYFGGYTNSQVARLTGVPLGTTKSRLRSALVQLRELVPER